MGRANPDGRAGRNLSPGSHESSAASKSKRKGNPPPRRGRFIQPAGRTDLEAPTTRTGTESQPPRNKQSHLPPLLVLVRLHRSPPLVRRRIKPHLSPPARAREGEISLCPRDGDGGVDGSTMKRAQPQPEPGRLCLVAWLAATEQLAGPGEGL